MDALSFFFLHVVAYAAFPLYFATLNRQGRVLSFHIYIALTLALGGLFGPVYSLHLAPGIDISGGALLYGAFMMGTILLIASESNLEIVKSIIRLVIVVNLFAYTIYAIGSYALVSAEFSAIKVDPNVFPAAAWVIMLGGVVIIGELLLLLAVLEFVKPRVRSLSAMAVVYTAAYVAVLCVDGLVFPLLLVGINAELLGVIAGNLTTKLVVASAFALPIIFYLTVFPEMTKRYMSSPLYLRGLLPFATTLLRNKIRRQEQFLALSENQLRELAKRHALSAESAGIGFWSIDTRQGLDRAIEGDERCHDIHDYSREELAGDTFKWLQLVVPADREKLADIYNNSESLDWPLTVQFRIRRKDKAQRYIEVYARREKSPPGTVRVLGVLRDVTDAVELQNRHVQLQEQLYRQQKMESVGQFAGGIAHDFNNLLTPIIGLAELNRTADADREEIRHDIEEIWKAGLSAKELTNKLLAFGSRQVLTPIAIDLNRVIFELDTILSHLISENIERVYELCDEKATIDADRGQIEQVLLNLVSNACDSMPNGGALIIRTERVLASDLPTTESSSSSRLTGSAIRLSVIDHGTGMEPDVLDRIFDPFYSTKDRNKGTGLGLATSFGIVQQHNGSIHASSTPDKGTVLQVTFPAVNSVLQTAKSEHRAYQMHDKIGAARSRILVVEDDPAVRLTVDRVLSAQGYAITTESNPVQALARDTRDVDLVVTDLIMPEMSGAKLVRELRVRQPDIKILMISGYHDLKLAPQEHFLQKPFSADELLTSVSTALSDELIPANGS